MTDANSTMLPATVVAALLGTVSPSSADSVVVLPEASTTFEAVVNGVEQLQFNSVTSTLQQTDGTVSATYFLQSQTQITGSASVPGNDQQALLHADFDVQLRSSGTERRSSAGDYQGIRRLDTSGNGQNSLSLSGSFGGGGFGGGGTTFASIGCSAVTCTPTLCAVVSVSVSVGSNAVQTVTMQLVLQASTTCGSGCPGGDSDSGSFDPIITIDPTFALADEFQLVFSQALATAPAPPAPSLGQGCPA
jgi:hypothetical protein